MAGGLTEHGLEMDISMHQSTVGGEKVLANTYSQYNIITYDCLAIHGLTVLCVVFLSSVIYCVFEVKKQIDPSTRFSTKKCFG